MAHFAKVLDGVVTQVIVAEQDFIDSYVDTSPGEWIQTSYNTHGGVHATGGTPLRYNFAAVGYHYDADADAFYPPQPYPSWTLSKVTYTWKPPKPKDVFPGAWDEENQQWVEV